MNVQHIAIRQTQTSKEAGHSALTPEQLAAVFAKMSRSTEPVADIIAKIKKGNSEKVKQALYEAVSGDLVNENSDPERMSYYIASWKEISDSLEEVDEDGGVESIFRFLDFGHQSIADMPPVALAIEGLSIQMIWYIWYLVAQGSGIETSTRYCKFDYSGLVDPKELGIKAGEESTWVSTMERGFESYNRAYQIWEHILETYPEALRLPESILSSTSPKDRKFVERIRKNYAFDRSRYFIPVACSSSMGLVLSGREWVRIARTLRSSLWIEAQQAGDLIADQLEYVIPHLTKHSTTSEPYQWASIYEQNKATLRTFELPCLQDYSTSTVKADVLQSIMIRSTVPEVNIMIPNRTSKIDVLGAFETHRESRYNPIGKDAAKVGVNFYIPNVSFAEIRDMNRHRPGTREVVLAPRGFYFPDDQIPIPLHGGEIFKEMQELKSIGIESYERSRNHLLSGDSSYLYWGFLGQQYDFEQTTTLDKLAYILELRTGPGVHFRYAKHYREVAQELFKQFPELEACIPLGNEEIE